MIRPAGRFRVGPYVKALGHSLCVCVRQMEVITGPVQLTFPL